MADSALKGTERTSGSFGFSLLIVADMQDQRHPVALEYYGRAGDTVTSDGRTQGRDGANRWFKRLGVRVH
jgi:hypothetical protein